MKIKVKLKNDTLLFICASALLLYTFLPIISGYIGAYVTLPFLVLGYFTLVVKYRQFIPLMTGELIISCIYLLFSSILRSASSSGLLNLYYFIFESFYILLPIFCLKTKKYLLLKKLFLISIGLILITEITTIIGTQIYPEATRYLVSSEAGGTSIGLQYIRMNIGGFTIAYIMPAIIIVMFLLVRKRLLDKKFYLFFSGISFIFLISAQFTMAILIFLFTVIVLLVSLKKPRRVLINSLIIVVIMLFFSNRFGNLLIQLANNVDSGMIRGRLNEIGNVLLGGRIENTLAISSRINVYQQSLQVFKKNVFFGGIMHGEVLGGHSHIIDFMAMFGIFGMLFFVMHYRYTLKTIFRHTEYNSEKILLFFAFVMLVMSMLVNPVFSYGFCWGIYGIMGGGVAILTTNNESNMN